MTQSIFLDPNVANLKITSDGFLEFDVIYTSDNAALSGLSLRLLYDDQQLTLQEVTDVLTTNRISSGTPPLIAGQNLQTTADTNNVDGDNRTNRIFNQAWADTTPPNDWPGNVPVTLYKVKFEVADGVTNPILRFVGGAAQGQTFDSPGTPDKDAISVIGVNSLPVFASVAPVSLVQRSTGNVVTVVATDADEEDTLTYSITGGNLDVDGDGNSAFAIDSATGLITVNDAGDLLFGNAALTDNKFTLTVSANDGLESSTASVTVEITNAAPVFGTFDAVTIDEDSDVGTPIGTFTADAVDGDTLTYSIFSGNTDVDGDGNLAFAINPETGAITVNDSGDLVFATQPTFELVVRASDPFAATADTTVVVNLNEVDKGGIIGQDISAADFISNNLTLAAGQTFTVNNDVRSNASLNNLVAFYRIDNLTGAIDGVNPGDAGYLAKALSRIENDVLIKGQGENNAVGSGGGSSFTNSTGATAFYAPILIANGGRLDSVFDLLEVNSGNNASSNIAQPAAYFIFDAANAKLGGAPSSGNFFFDAANTSLRVEDLHIPGTSDSDYNDLSFSF